MSRRPVHRLDDPAQFTGLPRSRHAGGVRDAGPSPRSSRSGMVASLIEAFRSVAWERDDLVADQRSRAPLRRSAPRSASAGSRRHKCGQGKRREAGHGGWAPPRAPPIYASWTEMGWLSRSFSRTITRDRLLLRSGRAAEFLLHNRGSGFNLTQDIPTSSSLASGRSTLSPALWTSGTSTRWVLGTRGASLQPQILGQVGAWAILAGQSLEEAQNAPRWAITEFGPFSDARFQVEPGVPTTTLSEAPSRGHIIEEVTGRQLAGARLHHRSRQGPSLHTPDPRRHHQRSDLLTYLPAGLALYG